MNEMVERVARALSEYGAPNFPFEGYTSDYQEAKRKEARIAIKAMRDPTDKMLLVCNSSLFAWQAMIDTALWEK